MEDKDIISLYNARDEQAIRATDDKYGSYCKTIAVNILYDPWDADECVNDTWLRVWKAIPPTVPRSLKAFVGRITRNLAIDRYRRNNSQKAGSGTASVCIDELSECLSSSHDPIEEYVDQEAFGKLLNDFLARLSERDRKFFVRRYFYVDSIADIAERYGKSVDNVKISLHRSRKKLGRMMETVDW